MLRTAVTFPLVGEITVLRTAVTSPLVGEVAAFFAAGEGYLMSLKNEKGFLKRFKKSLRKSQTDAESILWYHLRNRNFQNYKFRRQHILCGYIVDFVCLEKKFIIELDGGQHAERTEYDSARTIKLEADGFQVLRFWNNEIFNNIENVLETIYEALNAPHPPQKARRPLPQGER